MYIAIAIAVTAASACNRAPETVSFGRRQKNRKTDKRGEKEEREKNLFIKATCAASD